VSIRWLTAFIDLPASDFEAGTSFWAKVTDSTLSAPRGANQQFATLLPQDGDAYVRVQRVASGPGGVHLDLHVEDVTAEAWRAVSLGATELARPEEGLVLLTSPGGFVFCTVGGHAWQRPLTWPGIVDQVCLDVSPSTFEDEAAFWAALTMWEPRRGRRGEFEVLDRPEGMPLRLILQRLDDDRPGPVTAHLDLAGGDQLEAVVERHLHLGARAVRSASDWVTLRDPVGREYCVTRRDPKTGLLPQ
jgi:predicted enzyme related to lactoylglutathione lyase